MMFTTALQGHLDTATPLTYSSSGRIFADHQVLVIGVPNVYSAKIKAIIWYVVRTPQVYVKTGQTHYSTCGPLTD